MALFPDTDNRLTLNYSDFFNRHHASIERTNVDYLPDVLEAFLTFLHAMGYDYVRKVVVVQSDGSERSTL
ncbi:hypothetical protein UFOVP346_19 [uncultured Caudovirales phage]|uniref:Uncharacterized protein n=1 Tax=uncultured Caudovirales phage TaxID=2100421 RepID=A0A6J5LX63_9CAUD|nr:hypothetical protein UFOVP346_19 [uncultured Caudovirales phage]